jgi:hypothetical protein
MEKKKWHENIPENGVLCRHKDGRTLLIKTAGDEWGFDVSSANSHYLNDLTPITAAEWWDFAPCQNMESAPINIDILIDIGGGKLVIGRGYKDIFITPQGAIINNPVKWIPLPQVRCRNEY